MHRYRRAFGGIGLNLGSNVAMSPPVGRAVKYVQEMEKQDVDSYAFEVSLVLESVLDTMLSSDMDCKTRCFCRISSINSKFIRSSFSLLK